MQPREKRRRRRHTAQFKAATVVACRDPGASVAAVALDRKLNANLVRRWIKQAGNTSTMAKAIAAPEMTSFLPLRIDTHAEPASSTTQRPIRVQIRKGRTRITIEWPTTAAGSCALWLRELLG